jgi:hypothetical protein
VEEHFDVERELSPSNFLMKKVWQKFYRLLHV